MKSLVFITSLVTVLMIQFGWSQIPKTISYQGVLTDGSGVIVPDGNYNLTFKLYDVASGGTDIWNEAHVNVPVSDGIFNVILGSINPLNLAFDKPYWLGIKVGTGTEMSPRIEVTASAYSLNAGGGGGGGWTDDGTVVRLTDGADHVGIGTTNPINGKLEVVGGGTTGIALSSSGSNALHATSSAGGGFAAGYFSATGSGTYGIWAQSSDYDAIYASTSAPSFAAIRAVAGSGAYAGIFTGGNVGIGTTTPAEQLQVAGTVQMDGFKMPTGASTGRVLTCDASGIGSWQPSAGGIGGGGTTNYLPKFTGSTTLGNSILYETGGNIGIGTTSPIYRFQVAGGDIQVGYSDAYRVGLYPSLWWDGGFGSVAVGTAFAGADLSLYAGSSSPRMFIDKNSGNIGIGLTSPTAKLQVAGIIHSTTGGIKFPDGTVQTTAATGSSWNLSGNSGTTAGTNFLGTTDNTALEIKVNSTRVVRFEPHATSPNILGGFIGNTIMSGVEGATVSGGGLSTKVNNITDNYGVISGGSKNTAGNENGDPNDARYATIGGGYLNKATFFATIAGGRESTAGGQYAAIGGGGLHTCSGYYATIGGGFFSESSSQYTTVAGGRENKANMDYGTVGGGWKNTASGLYSTVAGGINNDASAKYATVGGGGDDSGPGFGNAAGGEYSTVSGGRSCVASAIGSTVSGGYANWAQGNYANVSGGGTNYANGAFSMVAGGRENTAAANYTFAAGLRAKANHQGAFVWADYTEADFASIRNDEFAVRAGGGLRLQANNSSYGGYVDNQTGGGDGFRSYANVSSGNNWGAIYAINSGTSPAIYSSATTAAYFNGNVTVTGTLSKGGGSFKIDHPLDPANKYLYHSFVESPDMMNVYNGNIVLNADGEAWVELPDWFEALNKDFRYQLTAIGAPGPNLYIAQKIAGNRFKIAGGEPGMEVSWQVTGIRHDAFAEKNRIPVEEMKSAQEAGKYLHPAAYGLPETMGINYSEKDK